MAVIIIINFWYTKVKMRLLNRVTIVKKRTKRSHSFDALKVVTRKKKITYELE